MKRTFAFLLSAALVSLSAANLIPGDTSAETERATAGNGNFGAMIYGFGDARLIWDKSNGFDGRSSLKTMAADVYSLKSSLKLKKGEKYTFSFYAKSEHAGVRGQINCVPSDLRQWPHPAGGRNIVFTPEWKRYSFTFTALKDGPHSGIYRVFEDKAKVNFDAFMLEPGEQASPYCPASNFTVGISSNEIPGNIVYLNEDLNLTVSVRRFKGTGKCSLKIRIVDKTGKTIKDYEAAPVFDRDGMFRFTPDFTPAQVGWFKVEAEIRSQEGTSKDSRSYVVTVPAVPADRSILPFSGICSLFTPREIFLRMGASWRYYAQGFSYAASEEGKIKIYGMNSVRKDKEAGLAVKLMIDMHPPMRLFSAEEKAAMKQYGLSPVRFVPGKHADDDWQKFMRELVDKYWKYVDVWEFGGELDARFGLNPYYKNKYPDDLKGVFSTGHVSERTAELICAGASIIREKNPDAVITAVRPCDVDCRNDFLFSSSVYSRLPGVLNSFGIDSYARPRRIGPKEPLPGPVTDLIEQHNAALKAVGKSVPDSKNIFISEFGYELMLESVNDPALLNRYACCLAQSLLMARAAGFTSIGFYTSLGMHETGKSTYAHWIGENPLPSVATYCSIARFLRNVKTADFSIPSADTVAAIYGKSDGSACGAVWTCNPENAPDIVMDSVSMTDMDGLPRKFKADKGKIRFSAGYEPVLFYVKNYAEAKKVLAGMKFIMRDPLKADFRMKTRNLVKLYLSSKSTVGPVRCLFTYDGRKNDVLVPPSEYVILELPLKDGQKKISLTLDFPENGQQMSLAFDIPKMAAIPKLAKPFKPDASPEKWQDLPAMNFDSAGLIYPIDVFGWHGKDDLSVRLNLAHDGKHLYIFAAVKDDLHCNRHSGQGVAAGDIFQIAFDPKTNTFGTGKDGRRPDDTNIALALASGKTVPVFYYGPDRQLFEHSEYAVRRDENSKTTFYELKIPMKSLDINPASNRVFGFSAVVFDDDSNTRWDYYMNLFPGITGGFDPARFGLFILQQ